MKTFQASITAFVLLLAIVLPGVSAVVQTPFDGTDVCQENGQRYDVATWIWTGNAWVKEYERPGFDTTLTGTSAGITWTSNKEVRAAFAVTESGATVVADRARDGSASGPGLTAIVLCSRGSSSGSNSAAQQSSINQDANSESQDSNQNTEVPEFGSVLTIAAIGLLGAAAVAAKRS